MLASLITVNAQPDGNADFIERGQNRDARRPFQVRPGGLEGDPENKPASRRTDYCMMTLRNLRRAPVQTRCGNLLRIGPSQYCISTRRSSACRPFWPFQSHSSPPPTMPTLCFTFPEKDEPSVVALRGARITVGRSPDNTIQIVDRTLSAHHAVFIFGGRPLSFA